MMLLHVETIKNINLEQIDPICEKTEEIRKTIRKLTFINANDKLQKIFFKEFYEDDNYVLISPINSLGIPAYSYEIP